MPVHNCSHVFACEHGSFTVRIPTVPVVTLYRACSLDAMLTGVEGGSGYEGTFPLVVRGDRCLHVLDCSQLLAGGVRCVGVVTQRVNAP